MVMAQAPVEVSGEQVDDLVKTLESETARNELIDKLKVLTDAQAEEEEESGDSIPIDFGFDRITNKLITVYDNLIEATGLNQNLLGQLILTTCVIIVAFLLAWALRKLSHIIRNKLHQLRDHYHLTHERFRLYVRYIRYVGYIIIATLAVYTIGAIWGVNSADFTLGETSRSFLVDFSNIAIIIAIGIILMEFINTVIEYYIQTLDGTHSTRMLTIIPVARNVIFFVFILLFSLVVLSEIGIDVMPLLAGAGVLGIAIGFGAQAMVRDFLNGFVVILEDLIQVGDVVKLGDRMGLIEKITIRKVQLRDLSGIVYTVPFGEITIVENWTKEFSYYMFDIGVAYRENSDEVIEYLKEIDEDMREDDNFKNLILSPLEVLGVDHFADSAVVIKARIKTCPIKQWEVGREFNRRMKFKFDEHNIEIPFPHQTIYFGQDKKGNAPSAPIELMNKLNNDDKDNKGEKQ